MKDFRSWTIFALLCVTSIAASIWLSGGTNARPFAIAKSFESALSRFIRVDSEAPSETAQPKEPDLRTHFSPQQHQISNWNSVVAASDHTASDSQVCSRPRTKSRTDTGTQLVYKWVDDEGQTHLSDTPPSNKIATVMDMAGGKRDFTYVIQPDGITLPISFQGQISAGSKRMYDAWHFFLGEKNLRQSHIKLRVIGGPNRYDAFRASAWPNSKPTNGFYDSGKNEAYVKYDSASPKQAITTSFHEISHLITASHLGPTPPWLTEGLAEYFETMEVKSQQGIIVPNSSHINLLKRSQLPRLKDFLAIDRSQWNGAQRDLNYAVAWSLMSFLMQDTPGMYAMQEVVQQAHAKSCKPFSAATALHQAYPGGLQKLESDWRKWLSNGHFLTKQT